MVNRRVDALLITLHKIVVSLQVALASAAHQFGFVLRFGRFQFRAFGWFGHNHGHPIQTAKAPVCCARKSARLKSPARPSDSGKVFNARRDCSKNFAMTSSDGSNVSYFESNS